jgi:hypothetical protein
VLNRQSERGVSGEGEDEQERGALWRLDVEVASFFVDDYPFVLIGWTAPWAATALR